MTADQRFLASMTDAAEQLEAAADNNQRVAASNAKTIAEILADERRPRGSWHHPIDPTPAEIAAACAKIQAGWTPEERYKRRRGVEMEPPAGGKQAEAAARLAVEMRLERQRARAG